MSRVVVRQSSNKGQRCTIVYSDDDQVLQKSCSVCRDLKAVGSFHRDPSTLTGLKASCKDCSRARDKRRYDANPVHFRDKTRRSRYKFAPGDFEAMYEAQAGRCRICDKEKRLVVDHDHDSGAVRGLLCQSCNGAIGALGDDVNMLTSAIAYLLLTKGDDLSL